MSAATMRRVLAAAILSVCCLNAAGQGAADGFGARPAGGAAAWQPLPASHPAMVPASGPPPAQPSGSRFPNRPAFDPPGQFPVGAQTPLPIR